MTRSGDVLVGAVLAHVTLTGIHGLVHLTIPVRVHGFQYGAGVLVAVVPLVAAALSWRGRTVTGGWLALLSGLGALLFEGYYHFVAANPDHVATVTSDPLLFATTAALTTAGDALLAAVALVVLAREVAPRSVLSPVRRRVRDTRFRRRP